METRAKSILSLLAILAALTESSSTSPVKNDKIDSTKNKDSDFENILLSSYCPAVPQMEKEFESFRQKRSVTSSTPTHNAPSSYEHFESSGNDEDETSGDEVDEIIDYRDMLKITDIRHHSYEELVEILQNITRVCVDVARMYKVGESTSGKGIWAIEFTTNPGIHEILKPEFRYVANIHGNEVTGRELTLQLSRELCQGYLEKDERITSILSSTRIHIIPSMNPDGYEFAMKYASWKRWTIGRYNWQGIDLNRNFPDLNDAVLPFAGWRKNYMQLIEKHHIKKGKTKSVVKSKIESDVERVEMEEVWGYNIGCARKIFDGLRSKRWQPETKAIMNWMASIPFVLSISFHDGGVGAFYPFDEAIPGQWEAETPDNDLFRQLAKTYANNHEDMWNPEMAYTDMYCRYYGGDYRRKGGISNGAAWFGVHGSMEDYSYSATNCFGIVVENTCEKVISSYKLEGEWRKNKPAMLAYIEQIHIGIKGVVKSSITRRPLEGAVVHIFGIFRDVVTTENGEYWRPLVPGSYTIQVRYGSIMSDKIKVRVLNKRNYSAQIVNFEMIV